MIQHTAFPRLALVAAAIMAATPRPVHAQLAAPSALNVGPTEEVERWRLDAIVDSSRAASMLLRSTSVMHERVQGRSLLLPRITMITNSALPFGSNNGWLWAGRGVNLSVAAGVSFANDRFRVVLAPELIYSANDSVGRDSQRFFAPDIPADRSEYTLLWYSGPFSADVPIRFGDRPISRLTPGQSSAAVRIGVTELGFGTENHWWGPGYRNALVLSNNAPGFPHFFLRSTRPWVTRLGDVELRWIVGGLNESGFFDTTSTNDLRSLAAAAVTLQPWWAPDLTLGFSRSVMGTSTGWSEIPLRWFEVFHKVVRAEYALNDSTMYPGGREQIFAFFGRFRLPQSGFEGHVEWARSESPRSVRDLLIAPSHTRAYTLGMQWRSSPDPTFWRAQTEITTLEQGSSFRDRPLGVMYTSRRVIQGYTNRGQPLGASVGPGSSSQWLAFDRFTPTASYGLYGGRIRHNEDVRSIYPFPAYQSYCNRDINMYVGMRGSRDTPAGRLSLDATFGNRLNVWFQMGGGCPGSDGALDVRNRTLSITLQPFRRPARPVSGQ